MLLDISSAQLTRHCIVLLPLLPLPLPAVATAAAAAAAAACSCLKQQLELHRKCSTRTEAPSRHQLGPNQLPVSPSPRLLKDRCRIIIIIIIIIMLLIKPAIA
jgi:hypothetical protein